jgi:RHS repeat-associated protein
MVPEKARAEFFRYDGCGNIYEAQAGALERTYGKGNRLERRGNARLTWDDQGRLVEKATYTETAASGDLPVEVWTYEWNGAGLMASAQRSDGLVVDFAYDALARRLEKRVRRRVGSDLLPIRNVRFVWDGDVLLHEIREEARAAGDPVVEERTYWFQDDGFEPLAHREKRVDDTGRESHGWFHYLNDAIGAPERLIDETGEVAAEYHRKAWGELEVAGKLRADTPVRLQGQYWDEETGLAYNRWRYYDGAGEFVSADPLGVEPGLNSFGFGTNTFDWADPNGLWNRRRQNGQFAAKPGPKPQPNSAHGNSLASTRPCTLYAKTDANGGFLK